MKFTFSCASDPEEMTCCSVSCPREPTTHFSLPIKIEASPELSTLLSAVPLPEQVQHPTSPCLAKLRRYADMQEAILLISKILLFRQEVIHKKKQHPQN